MDLQRAQSGVDYSTSNTSIGLRLHMLFSVSVLSPVSIQTQSLALRLNGNRALAYYYNIATLTDWCGQAGVVS